MSNGKGGRNKILISVVTLVLLVLSILFEENITDNPFVGQPKQEEQATTELSKNEADTNIVDGNLTITMIAVGQADSFLMVQDGKIAKTEH